MTRALLLVMMAGCALLAEELFIPGLRCLYFCQPDNVLDGVHRAMSMVVVLALSGMWGALCARLTRGHAIYLPLLSILLAGAAILGLLSPSSRVFGAIGGMAAAGFSMVRWNLLGSAGRGQSEGNDGAS